MKLARIFTVIMMAVLLGMATDGFARSRGSSRTRQNPPPVPDHVISVDTTGKSITVEEGKSSATYKIDSFTTITINGAKGKLEEIQKGMMVTVVASGKDRASRVDVQDAPASTTKKK
jgi:hypothetical protein